MPSQQYHLNVTNSLRQLLESKRPVEHVPLAQERWRNTVSQVVDWQRYEELYGGHRNLVVKERHSQSLLIYWQASEHRWEQILRALLLEDCVARQFALPGRVLADPDQPVEISEQGFYRTRMQAVPAEYRYPWSLAEIASAARLLGDLHAVLRQITFDSQAAGPATGEQWLHLDFARGNVLFEPHTTEAKAVIDYETATVGPREQELGRTASYLLVDASLADQNELIPHRDQLLRGSFAQRLDAWLSHYPAPFNKQQVLLWTASYLLVQDYGSLNAIRDLASSWLKQTYHLADELADEGNPAQ
jgi:hypothetical protein